LNKDFSMLTFEISIRIRHGNELSAWRIGADASQDGTATRCSVIEARFDCADGNLDQQKAGLK
jgi:hypothetical protein